MTRNLLIVLVLAACSITAEAQTLRPRAIAEKVSAAYRYDLSKLDAARLINRSLKVMIEDSITGKFETRYFGSFRSMERWLKKQQRPDGTPIRESRDLLGCTNARCSFNFDGGISHNHLYLKRITFGYRKGHRYVKELMLLDGA